MAQGLKHKVTPSINPSTVATLPGAAGLSALSLQPAGTVPTVFIVPEALRQPFKGEIKLSRDFFGFLLWHKAVFNFTE